MDVPLGADDAFGQLHHARGADEHATGRAGDLAAGPHGQVDAQRNPVGEGQLHLAVVARGAEHANVGQHAATRADDHHRLCGGVEAVLVERSFRR